MVYILNVSYIISGGFYKPKNISINRHYAPYSYRTQWKMYFLKKDNNTLTTYLSIKLYI